VRFFRHMESSPYEVNITSQLVEVACVGARHRDAGYRVVDPVDAPSEDTAMHPTRTS